MVVSAVCGIRSAGRAPDNGPSLLSDCAELARTARSAMRLAGHAVAAFTFGIPIISVTIAEEKPHLRRGRYRAHARLRPCGRIDDGDDKFDLETARDYLAREFAPLRAAAEIARYRDAAQRLVRSPWAQDRIRLIADALLRQGTLNGEEIA